MRSRTVPSVWPANSKTSQYSASPTRSRSASGNSLCWRFARKNTIAVTPGTPIVALATIDPVRIVGYLRPPIQQELKPGMKVRIRTRGLRRQSGSATILGVGTQLEIIPATLLGPVNFASIVQGLPLNISLPSHLKLRAGEVVDIALLRRPD